MPQATQQSNGVGGRDLLASLAWPIVALIVLALFYSPLKDTLDKAAQGQAEEISVGTVKVRFSPRGLSEMPAPPVDVSDKINSLAEFERETLISIGSYSPHEDSCTLEGFVEP